MNARIAPLPTLPLWLATLLALGAESGVFTLTAVWLNVRADTPPESIIEVSLADETALEPGGSGEEVATAGATPAPAEEAVPSPEPPAQTPDESTPAETPPDPPQPVSPPTPEPGPTPEPEAEAPSPPETPPESSADDAVSEPEQAPVPAPAPAVPAPPPPKPESRPKPKPQPRPEPQPKPARHPAPVRPAEHARAHAPAPHGSTGGHTGTASGSTASSRGLSLPAAYRSNPPPTYPANARHNHEEGTVHLRVHVDARGRAREVRIARSSGVSSLDQAALRAVRRWRFRPAKQDGKPIEAWVRIPIRFRLRD